MFKNFSQLKNGVTKLVEEKDEMYMNVDFLKCQKNETFTFNFNEEEAAFLLIQGEISISFNNKEISCSRKDCFKEEASCLHVSKNTKVTITALKDSEILIQHKENQNSFEPVFYDASNIDIGYFGEGPLKDTTRRKVTTILDYERTPYSNMVLGEIINLPGIWSSYPPHHHPQPEVYFYKFDKPQGFGTCFIGEDAYKIHDNSVALIEGGKTHPQNAAPGYAMYYVWMIPHLENNPWTKTRIYDPEHEWVNSDKLDVFKF